VASRTIELEAVKAELTRVRSELATATSLPGARVTTLGQSEGCKGQDCSLVWIHHTWVVHSKWRSAKKEERASC
jgi:hypothetical protein